MKQGSNLQRKMVSVATKIARYEAKQAANTSCIIFAYQPKLPEAVKKLRKF